MSIDESLTGRVAIVTGGGSGIGRAITVELANVGVNCVIAGSRESELDDTLHCTDDAPGTVVAVPSDVSTYHERQKLVASAVASFGGLDILVNNVGVTATTHSGHSPEVWRRVFATQVAATFFLAQAAIPALRKSSQARIVNIGAVYGSLAANKDKGEALPEDSAGDGGPTGGVVYSATKSAILQLTRELSNAIGSWGITVNSVSPGMIPVDAIPTAQESNHRLAEMMPLGRVGRPSEIASVVRFIAGGGSSYMTGSEIRVDGGWAA
jgi:NAD(P)-dependent dehydrogenase (short-subunit alcohol dehydrogenase family)